MGKWNILSGYRFIAAIASVLQTSVDSLLEKYTGVENYKGRADRIKKVMECVTAENDLHKSSFANAYI